MRTSTALTITAALLAGSITAASAADMPLKAAPFIAPVAYDWTGWYAGAGLGGLWGDSRWTDPFGGPATVRPSFDQAMVSFHGGFLHQFKGMGIGGMGLVIGLDQSGTFPIDNATGKALCPGPVLTCGTRMASLFTTGAILGLAWDRVLLSARGGWAGGNVATRTFVTATGVLFDQTDQWHNGWYVGGGLDWAFYKTAGSSWILGAEYQHFDLGTEFHGPLAVAAGPRNVNVTGDLIKAKLTVKLDGPPFFVW